MFLTSDILLMYSYLYCVATTAKNDGMDANVVVCRRNPANMHHVHCVVF
jgi:hypothetical protein